LALIIYTVFALPELWQGSVATFATIGGFVTVYGVVFAIIETWRARAASEMACRAAAEANRRVVILYNVKNIAECQACIRDTLGDLDKDGWASTAALSRILELYTAEFHEAYRDPGSQQRESIAALQSHAASASGPLKGRPLTRLKDTLVKMLADLTAAAGRKMSETPQ
jgi:hypothetical protein